MLVLVLSACIRVEQDIVIDDNGSGEVNAIFAINSEAFGELAELSGEDLSGLPVGGDDFCDQMAGELVQESFDDAAIGLDDPPRVNEYRDGDFCGLEMSFELPEADDHSQTLAGFFGEVRLERVDDGWVFDAVPEDNSDDFEDVGGGFETNGDLGGFEELLGFEYLLTVQLPGEAIDGQHNATEVDGGRFVWDVDLQNPPDRFFAQTGPAGFSFPWALLFGLLIIGAVIYGVYWFFTNERAQEGTSLQESLSAGEQPVNPSDPSDVFTQTGGAVAGAGYPQQATDATAATTTAAATATLEPQYDAAIGAWVVFHPEQGRLRHDPATDQWVPA